MPVFSVWMTVPWQCSVQPMSGVSAVFILDDRCNLPLYQLTGQSISHYSFQTILSWLGFPRYSNKFSSSSIMYGTCSLQCNSRNFFFSFLFPMQQLRYLILFHTLICLLFIFISSPTLKSPPLSSLSLILFVSFQGNAKTGFARVIYFLLGD